MLFISSGCGDGNVDAIAESEAESESESETEADFLCPASNGASDVSARLKPNEVRAGRITDPEALVGGDSADGQVGDFKIYNAVAQFVVQSERIGDNYIPYGGSVIDADFVREADEPGEDGIDEYVTTFVMNPFAANTVCVLQDGSDGKSAIVRAVGADAQLPLVGALFTPPSPYGLTIANDYILAPDSATLEVVTHVLATDGDVGIPAGDFILLSDDGVDPYRLGPGFDRNGIAKQLFMVGVAGEDHHFAYGFFADEPTDQDQIVTPALMGLGSSDMALFYPVRTLSFPAGEEVTWRRFLALGRDLDELNRARYPLQGITDLGTVSGTVTAGGKPVAGARVHCVEQAAGYQSFVRTNDLGTYETLLPAGEYTVTVTGSDIGQDVEISTRANPKEAFAHGYAKSAGKPATVVKGNDVEVNFDLSPPSHIAITLEDAEGNLLPGKLTLLFAYDDDEDPTAPDPTLGERNPYAFAAHQFWTIDGTVTADIEPGTYTFVASYGFERELASAGPLALKSGETTALTLILNDVVDSTGYLQGDHHMHGGPSIHGEATKEMRVMTNIAEGLDYFIASDHDRVIDYRPTMAALDVEGVLAVVQSNEISTFTSGHFNPYPLTLTPDEPNGGATEWWLGLSPQEMFDSAFDHGATILQINHGWNESDRAKGYFSATDYDAATGESPDPVFTFDFHAMETKNGKGAVNEGLFDVYLGLLNHGARVAPTGVSDSHHRIPEAGSVRTYTRLDATGPAEFDVQDFASAILSAHTVVSGGPFIRLEAEGEGGPGDTVMVSDGDVTLDIQVAAPSWIPIERIRIYQGQVAAPGESAALGDALVVMEWDSVENDIPDVPYPAPMWLDEQVELPVTEDTWFLVRVDGTSDLTPVYAGALPFAHTAAVFVEVPSSD